MDKFGIFNLINSFLSEYKSKTDNGEQSAPTTIQPKKPETERKKPEPAPYIPLKAELYNTIKEHDLFVKRVLKGKEQN